MAKTPPTAGGGPGDDDDGRDRAKIYWARANALADTGNFDYAIEMCLQGLAIIPNEVEAHEALRVIALRRTAAGHRPLGLIARATLKTDTGDPTRDMLAFEKLLAFDPGNLDHMIGVMASARRGGHDRVVAWIAPLIDRADRDGMPRA
jgi:hypothetical protein